MRKFWVVAFIFFSLLLFAYWNHFDNGFQFDDIHTIVDNTYIRDIGNIPQFFTDTETFGTNPRNRGYRPVVTTLNAIDYWLAGGLNPKYFHATYFFYYFCQLVLVFFFFKTAFAKFTTIQNSGWIAIIGTAFYGLHTANAETINYIISRSDQFSTLCILFGLVSFQSQTGRKYHLYLIPVIIGLATKEVTAVFPLLLFAYILLFENNYLNRSSLKNSFLTALPSFILVPAMFFLFMSIDNGGSATGQASLSDRINYLFTQSVVITHYLGNFLIPVELSVDPDFTRVDRYFSHSVLFSTGLLTGLLTLGIYSAFRSIGKPVAFGILWFFITLGPTSSLHPLLQISNDHRTFLPFIGLVMSVGWLGFLFYQKYLVPAPKKYTHMAMFAIFLILAAHTMGVRDRCEVWGSSLSLWKDGVEKSPGNARAHLNYGVALMARGDYENALNYFKKSESIWPTWSVTKINLGVIHEALNDHGQAEEYFKQAIRLTPYYPDCYYYYARFLNKRGRTAEAISQLKIGNSNSPGHAKINHLLSQIQTKTGQPAEVPLEDPEILPGTNAGINDYINASLVFYRKGDYLKCIEMCQEALKIDPDSAIAYNNICSAYNELKEWDKAKAACEKAIELSPDFQLARNNLNKTLQFLKE